MKRELDPPNKSGESLRTRHTSWASPENRTFHGKIVSLSMEKESEGPDDKDAWKVKGTYVRGRRKGTICSCCVLTGGSTDDQVKFNQTETALALGMLKYRRRHTKAQREARYHGT